MITLSINGQKRQFDYPLTVAELVVVLELAGKRVAIEKNGEIVPRSRHPETLLDEGDQLEVVVAVGGG